MSGISTHRPLDMKYVRAGLTSKRAGIRPVELDISGELDGHVINRRVYNYGGSIRPFAYQWAVEVNRMKNQKPKFTRLRYMQNRLKWQQYYMYAKDKKKYSNGGYVKKAQSGRKTFVSAGEYSKGRRQNQNSKTSRNPSLKSTANVYAKRSLKFISGGVRRCLVKIRYTEKSGVDIQRNNINKIAYIARKEATIAHKPFYELADEKNRVYTFDGSGKKVFVPQEKAIKKLGEDPVFRIILSPEDKNADLSELTRRFIKESFAPAVGCNEHEVEYVAANHYNTEHPHVHIIISRRVPERMKGKGRKKYLVFCKDYLRKGKAQKDAGRILTDFMGLRTREEAERINSLLIRAKTFTRIDREIHLLNHPRKDGTFYLSSRDIKEAGKSDQSVIKARLQYLMNATGKVSYDSDKQVYVMQNDWNADLKRADAVEKQYVTAEESAKLVFDEDKRKLSGNTIYKGKIKSFKFSDDDPNLIMFTIEDESGALHLLEEEIETDIEFEKLKDEQVSFGFINGARIPRLLNKKTLEKKLKRTGR